MQAWEESMRDYVHGNETTLRCQSTSVWKKLHRRLVLALAVFSGIMAVNLAYAAPWSLTLAQRKAYLAYYSPILMLRANEYDANHHGYSWITNFDFDRDRDFSNNKYNWKKIENFVQRKPDFTHWQIRPTLYSSLIEFMETNDSKSIVLLYHVYHAMQEDGIHDWERIEIRVNNVAGTPGRGSEQVRYTVVTRHKDHPYRLFGDSDLNFQNTPSGKHAMIWQAQWNLEGPLNPHMQELRFVEDSFANVSTRVATNEKSHVNINDANDRKNVHYVFVCGCAPDAANYWQARTLGATTANSFSSKKSDEANVNWSEVKRIRYELQDIADIFPTHWVASDYQESWTGTRRAILLESPIRSESGAIEVPSGRQEFYQSDVIANADGGDSHRDGYPHKIWIWGAYDFNGSDDVKKLMWSGDSSQPNRAAASGRWDSLNSHWWQHDYFAHDGLNKNYESGRWLPGNWYTPLAGGWDGRWVQIFED